LRCTDDVILLQEASEKLWDHLTNDGLDGLVDKYHIFARNATVNDQPGTAVLIRKEGILCPSIELGGQTEIGGDGATGGPSKMATLVPVMWEDRPLLLISIHCPFHEKEAERKELLKRVQEAAAGYNSVILAGDFNCSAGRYLDALARENLCLSELSHAPLPPGTMTGLSGDFSAPICIDHAFRSPGLICQHAYTEQSPANPWGNDP